MNQTNKYFLLQKADKLFLGNLVKKYGKEPESVLSLLKSIQEKYNYLPDPVLKQLCSITSITPQQITGIASFYSYFRQKPAGRHRIRVCIGTACYVKGAEQIITAFKKHLHIPDSGDTDRRMLFTVEQAACLGCCMLAPAVQIDDTIYGHLTPGKVPSVVANFLSSRIEQKKPESRDENRKTMKFQGEIRLCTCSSCRAAGALDVFKSFQKEIQQRRLPVELKEVGCTGLSFEAPIVEISMPGNQSYWYGCVGTSRVKQIMDHHFPSKGILNRVSKNIYSLLEKIYAEEETEPVIRYSLDFTQGTAALYMGRQVHIATENFGECGPGKFNTYIQHGGFAGFKKCIHEIKSPDKIISILKNSRLRGRGGAGFPVYKKWENVFMEKQTPGYLICNGDEGDPGAFMDRMLLESFPLRIIEGILIAGFTLNIHQGIIYIRTEYPLALERISKAIELCVINKLLGDNILNSDFSFHLKIVEGAGAFVCGEETALIKSIEGNRGMPDYRPPYPSKKGLFGKPTLIQNVETIACLPWIITQGPAAFARLGTKSSGGTKTFALAGKIERGGLIEVPIGITLKEIVEDIGGGIQNHRKCKAIQIGGPSGGCIPVEQYDVPLDFDTLQGKGAIMGSGGMVVLDESDCMVEIARYFMAFTQNESCGKCTYCRIGTKLMLDILTRLTQGKGKDGDIEELQRLSYHVKQRSLCGLGKTAPNPVLSTLHYFHKEYEAHIKGQCPAKKCKALITYAITEKCIGCTKCAQGCPVGAIRPTPYGQHSIDVSLCIRCDACRQTCPEQAIIIK